MKFNDRELATVLAALRHWQIQRDRYIPGAHLDIATDGGAFERLDDDEIDDLCERLNASQDTAALRAELAELEAAFKAAGGRGVEMAERIDELRAQLGAE